MDSNENETAHGDRIAPKRYYYSCVKWQKEIAFDIRVAPTVTAGFLAYEVSHNSSEEDSRRQQGKATLAFQIYLLPPNSKAKISIRIV